MVIAMISMEELYQEFTPEQLRRIRSLITDTFLEQAKAEKATKVERFRRLNRFVKPRQILFAGSSLMEQFPIGELQQGKDLPLYIYNRGVGGFTTEEMLEVMGPCVYDLNPAYIFLNIGTNDLNDPACPPEVLAERYRRILTGIREHLPEAKLTLLAYYPVNEAVGLRNPYMAEVFKIRTNEKLRAANCAVEALAREFGAAFLDVNAEITDETGNLKAEYTVEGMHMYGDGYAEVLNALLPDLKQCK